MIKNILKKSKKYILAEEKQRKLIGRSYKIIVNKKLKWKHRKILKVKTLNYMIKKLKSVKLKKTLNYKKESKILIRLLFLLNYLKKHKNRIASNNVKKDLNKFHVTNTSQKILDFFYKKHTEEIEAYCFK